MKFTPESIQFSTPRTRNAVAAALANLKEAPGSTMPKPTDAWVQRARQLAREAFSDINSSKPSRKVFADNHNRVISSDRSRPDSLGSCMERIKLSSHSMCEQPVVPEVTFSQPTERQLFRQPTIVKTFGSRNVFNLVSTDTEKGVTVFQLNGKLLVPSNASPSRRNCDQNDSALDPNSSIPLIGIKKKTKMDVPMGSLFSEDSTLESIRRKASNGDGNTDPHVVDMNNTLATTVVPISPATDRLLPTTVESTHLIRDTHFGTAKLLISNSHQDRTQSSLDRIGVKIGGPLNLDTPSELNAVNRIASTFLSDLSSFAPSLSLDLLRKIDASAREAENMPGGRSIGGKNHDNGVSFLLDVKNQVETIKKNGGEATHRHHLDALTRQELLFDSGAVLSASDDSQGTDGESVDRFSVYSDQAVVTASFSGQRNFDAIRTKLRREGWTEELINRELQEHDQPDEIREKHRRRRHERNRFILTRKRMIEGAKRHSEPFPSKEQRPRNGLLLRNRVSYDASPQAQQLPSLPCHVDDDGPRSPVCGYLLAGSGDSSTTFDSPASPAPPDVQHDVSILGATIGESLPITTPLSAPFIPGLLIEASTFRSSLSTNDDVNAQKSVVVQEGSEPQAHSNIRGMTYLPVLTPNERNRNRLNHEMVCRGLPRVEYPNSIPEDRTMLQRMIRENFLSGVSSGESEEDDDETGVVIVEDDRENFLETKSMSVVSVSTRSMGQGPRQWSSSNGSPIKKSYTHDERIIAKRNQKVITAMFADLQKKLHRGELSQREFEEEKSKLFGEIFGCDDSGKIYVKETTAAGVRATRKRMRSVEEECVRRRGRHAFRMPGWKDADDTDAALEEEEKADDEDRNQYYDETDDSDFEEGTWVEVDLVDHEYPEIMISRKCRLLNSPYPRGEKFFGGSVVPYLASERKLRLAQEEFSRQVLGILTQKEREKRQQNIERREMLMRKFDQRAPPEERMFPQDTNLRSGPTPRQQQNWKEWHTPLNQRPNWMKENTQDRTVIFPESLEKIDDAEEPIIN